MYRNRGYYRFQEIRIKEKKEKRAWQIYGTDVYDMPKKNNSILDKDKYKKLSHADQKRKDRANYEFEHSDLHTNKLGEK